MGYGAGLMEERALPECGLLLGPAASS